LPFQFADTVPNPVEEALDLMLSLDLRHAVSLRARHETRMRRS